MEAAKGSLELEREVIGQGLCASCGAERSDLSLRSYTSIEMAQATDSHIRSRAQYMRLTDY